jgi:restriction endonuclease S subunit
MTGEIKLNFDRDGYESFRFDEIAQKISETVDPSTTDVERYVGLEHIDSGDIHIREYGSPDEVKGGKLKCYPGDVIFGKRRAYQRKAALVDFEGICSAHAFVFRANEEVIDPKLFPFFLHSDQFMHRMVDISVGGLSPTINWGDLKGQEFLLPPKDQQAEIAELLWAFDSSIEQMQSFLEEIKTSLKTIQNELFGCRRESVALGDLCHSFSGFPFKSKKMTGHGEHKLLRGINIKEGCFEWNEEIDRFYPIEEEDGRKMTSIVMELGDVVVPMDGSKLGKNYAVVDDKAEGSFLVQRIACFKVSSVLESNLLEAFFGSVFFERMVQKHNTTSAIPHISLKQLRAIDIPIINASVETTLTHYNEMRGIQALSVARLDNSKSLLQAMIASFF